MSTPHINAKLGDFAETCLFPGDPLRAKFIAEQYLEGAECVTNVRNMLGYTGNYKGQRISVMGSGMGMPSCAIYATELLQHYQVKRLVRVGSCGVIDERLDLNDVIIAHAAATDSSFNRQQFAGLDFPAVADPRLLQQFLNYADKSRSSVALGLIFSTDNFYGGDTTLWPLFRKFGVLGFDMEAAALYSVAAQFNAQALTVLSVSDNLLSGTKLSAADRQSGFATMIEFALNALTPSA